MNTISVRNLAENNGLGGEGRIQGKPLRISINRMHAEHLIVADLTSSDPYLLIKVNGIEVGKTSIKYKNLNPTWDEIVTYELVDREAEVSFQVMDYDEGKLGDFMGETSINLRDIPCDGSFITMNKLLDKAKRGMLGFSIALQKNMNLFEIKDKEQVITFLNVEVLSRIRRELDIICDPKGDVSVDVLFKVHEMVRKDLLAANTVDEDDVIQTLRAKVNFLLQLFLERLRQLALLGWCYKRTELRETIHYFLHEYFCEITCSFSTIFDGDRLHKIDRLDRKVSIIELFFEVNNDMNTKIVDALSILDLVVTPLPILADIFDTKRVLLKYTNVVYSQMIQYPMNVLNTAMRTSDRQLFPNAPWAPFQVPGQTYFTSTIPEDLKRVLNECLDYATVSNSRRDSKGSIASTLHNTEYGDLLNVRLEIGYSKCYYALARHVRSLLDKPMNSEDPNEIPVWLTSICNDISRILEHRIHLVEHFEDENKEQQEFAEIRRRCGDQVADELNALLVEIMSILADAILSRGFDDAKKLLPPVEFFQMLKEETSTFRAFFASNSAIDAFDTILSDKVILFYLGWLQDIISASKGDTTLEVAVHELTGRLETFRSPSKGLSGIFGRISVVEHSILEKSVSQFPAAEIWVAIPAYMEHSLDAINKLWSRLRHAMKQSLVMSLALKATFQKTVDEDIDVYTAFSGAVSDDKKIHLAIKFPRRRGSAMKAMQNMFKPPPASIVVSKLSPFEISSKEHILVVTSISASNLLVYQENLQTSIPKNVYVEFVLNNVSEKIPIKFNGSTKSWEAAASRIHFNFSDKVESQTLVCNIYYSNMLLLGTSVGETFLYGSIKIPVVSIDPLMLNPLGEKYKVDLFSKKMEENMLKLFQQNKQYNTIPVAQIGLSLD